MSLLKTSSRNSSFELLRFICIIFIISHHYFYHGNLGLPFTEDNISNGRVFLQIASMFGRTACSIFVLITGYFLINSRSVNIKKLVLLILEMLSYSIGISLFVRLLTPYEVSNVDIIKSFMPIPYGNWYCVYYILFILITPQLNKILNSLTKREYKNLLFIIIGIYSVFNTLIKNELEFSNIDFFFVMYIIGGYIRLHYENKYSNSYNLYAFITTTILIILSVVFFDYIGGYFHKASLIEHATYFQQFNTLPSVLFAISIFLYFSRLRINNVFLNFLGKSVLGIYLIHDNFVLRKIIWCEIVPNNEHLDSPYTHFFIKIIVVLLFALLLDIIRRYTLEKILVKILNSLKISNFLRNRNYVEF